MIGEQLMKKVNNKWKKWTINEKSDNATRCDRATSEWECAVSDELQRIAACGIQWAERNADLYNPAD